jgi:threonine dehydrogenase-like Zn-dependent dehydrogenase
MAALHTAISTVRRGGTVSISGVYGGSVDPRPLMEMFDKQVTLRMGQANVHRWTDQVLPLVSDVSDPLGVLDLRTHRVALEDAPAAYSTFQKKEDGCIKVVLDPTLPPDDAPPTLDATTVRTTA